MITMRDEVSAIVSATRSHAVRTIINLPFCSCLEIQTVRGHTLPLHILFYAMAGAESNEHDHWNLPPPTQTIPESARAGSGRPRWLATHPQHKPTQIAVIAGQHKLFARPRPRPFGNPNARKSEHRKTPHPRKGRGFDSWDLGAGLLSALGHFLNIEERSTLRRGDQTTLRRVTFDSLGEQLARIGYE